MRGPVPDGPKIGVLGPPHRPAEQLAGCGQKAGQLGFPEVRVAEDCFPRGAFTRLCCAPAPGNPPSTKTMRPLWN